MRCCYQKPKEHLKSYHHAARSQYRSIRRLIRGCLFVIPSLRSRIFTHFLYRYSCRAYVCCRTGRTHPALRKTLNLAQNAECLKWCCVRCGCHVAEVCGTRRILRERRNTIFISPRGSSLGEGGPCLSQKLILKNNEEKRYWKKQESDIR